MSDAWECASCGAIGQEKAFCETCGAAQPVEGGGEDSALSLMLGLVCERCDAYNDPGVAACVACGAALPSLEGSGKFPALSDAVFSDRAAAAVTADVAAQGPLPAPASGGGLQWMAPPNEALAPAPASSPAPAPPPPADAAPADPAPSTDQRCPSCGAARSSTDRFCRSCGHRVDGSAPPSTTQIAAFKLPAPGLPSPVLGGNAMVPALVSVARGRAQQQAGATLVFGAATAERLAKLVLVRGHSQFGTQWRLQAPETLVGRSDGVVLFPDDRAMAPRHCRLSWQGSELWLAPEPTTNGVYLRVSAPAPIGPGDEIVIGAQRLRVLADTDRLLHMTSPDPTTRVLGSVVRPGPVVSLLRIAPDPAEHEIFHRHQRVLTLGRNRCDVNFPRDGFVSERHAQLTRTDEGPLLIEDLRSRNGTYLRVRQPVRLTHGDLLLLGDKVLRVELPR